MAAENIIQKMGFFCKFCGKFFPFLNPQHRGIVYDDEGCGIAALYACPFCRQEAEYSSAEVTLESESDRKAMGLTPFEWPPKK